MLLLTLILIVDFSTLVKAQSTFADKLAAMSKQTEENIDNGIKVIGAFAPNPENSNKGKRPKRPKNKDKNSKNKNKNSYGGNNYVNRPKSPPKKTKPPKTTKPTTKQYTTYTTRTFGQETTPIAKTYPPTYPPIKRPLGVSSTAFILKLKRI